jgi:cytochrome c oxidase assembly protein subunit 15
MDSNQHHRPQHNPKLALFAGVGSAWVFVLVSLGAFTTSIGAGMAFPDWPLSNGSINPDGWLTDIAMFAEHSHRLSGTLMGFITIGLAVWLWRVEKRAWVRKLGWWALGIVIFQGLLGGKRVLLDSMAVPGFEMSLGQMLRIPHGVLAQVYVCMLFAIAVACSKDWIERSAPLGERVRKLGLWCCALLLLQLIVAATMRHNYAGLAIPVFPHSHIDGGWLPQDWNFKVSIHFLHRVLAVILTGVLIAFYVAIRRDRAATPTMRMAGAALMALLALQIMLGAEIIWTARRPVMTTSHVVVGTLLLATTVWLTLVAMRDRIEGEKSA